MFGGAVPGQLQEGMLRMVRGMSEPFVASPMVRENAPALIPVPPKARSMAPASWGCLCLLAAKPGGAVVTNMWCC